MIHFSTLQIGVAPDKFKQLFITNDPWDYRMPKIQKHTFKAKLDLIGINPFVYLPLRILNALLQHAKTYKGKIPVKGVINSVPYRQTLVKYRGEWRLYVNTKMLKNSPKRIGETLSITITLDPEDRTISPHPKLLKALGKNAEAKNAYARLRPYLQKEIIRYLSQLKTEESVDRNVARAINFLLGKGSFVGRNAPEFSK